MANSTVRLAGGLPDGDKNGLGALAPAMVNDPDATHVAVVLLDCSRLTTNVDDGSVLPTARIRAIEPIRGTGDAKELERLLRRAFERRTGMVELPLDLEKALDELGDVSLTDDDDGEREPDAAERAAGDDSRDDDEHRDPAGHPPGHPEYCAEGCIHVEDQPQLPAIEAAADPDAPDTGDELAADDPRRIGDPHSPFQEPDYGGDQET